MLRESAVITASLAAVLIASGCGPESGPAAAEQAMRVTHHSDADDHVDFDGDVELIVQGDKVRFTLSSTDETWVFVVNGKQSLFAEHEGLTAGPDSEYKLVEDWTQREDGTEILASLVVPDGSVPTGFFLGPCHEAGSGEYVGRTAVRFDCAARENGDDPLSAGTVWVDEQTRVALTPWAIDSHPTVDPAFVVTDPDTTFSVTPPAGADVRVQHAYAEVGSPAPAWHGHLIDERGRPTETVGIEDYAGRAYVLAFLPDRALTGDIRGAVPELLAPYQELSRATSAGVEPPVVGLTFQQNSMITSANFARNGIRFPIATADEPEKLIDDWGVLEDRANSLELAAVDAQGNVTAVVSLGYGLSASELNERIGALIASVS